MYPGTRSKAALKAMCIVLVLCTNVSSAQEMYSYVAVARNMTTTLQEKQILTRLAASDDNGEYSVDRTTGRIDVKTSRAVDRYQFEYMLGEYGMGLASFEQVDAPPVAIPGNAKRIPRLADMPLFMDTGDPVRDNERYDAYKAAWIAAHPDMYLELTTPEHSGK